MNGPQSCLRHPNTEPIGCIENITKFYDAELIVTIISEVGFGLELKLQTKKKKKPEKLYGKRVYEFENMSNTTKQVS